MKDVGKRLFIIAVVFALLAAGATFIYLKSLEGASVEAEMVTVLVASQDISARTMVTEEMIKEMKMSADMDMSSIINDRTAVIGQYTKESIFVNEPFHTKKLILEVRDELSLKITGSNRAVTISTNGASAVAKMIKPGDYVDIVLYLPSQGDSGGGGTANITKFLLQRIEILAINQDMYRESGVTEEAEQESGQGNFLVTFSVPVQEVERLVLAEQIGTLELALRPMEDDYIYNTEGVIWQELLLNDFNQMKDMYPEYEIISLEGTPVEPNVYTYDKYIYYTVKFGDTLSSISEDFYGDPNKYDLIMQVNRIEDENLIITGTGLKIPVLE